MKRIAALAWAGCLMWLAAAPAAWSFCGFYVAKADASLFNKASRVVLARDGDRTVLTMVNDFKGDPKEFAVVVPVPTLLQREQIHVTDMAIIDHLDAYTAPRLVEYFDDDPCAVRYPAALKSELRRGGRIAEEDAVRSDAALGVTVEATYTVGEYDIVILSAEQSDGLETWLRANGYRIPDGATRVLGSYIKQNMRFFVAKVNLEEKKELGFQTLRPIQIAYESPKLMLPIRLGMINADGPQDLLVYALTRTGRIETTNYRTVKLPTGMELPVFVKDEFGAFYRDMFARQVRTEDMRAVFLEYAWDMAWCDPCAANPLPQAHLRELGAFWLDAGNGRQDRSRVKPQAQNVFVTRLHVRYDAASFPEDLVFQETGDRQNFQGRYVLRHPWTGDAMCDAAQRYRADVRQRQRREAQQLAHLTGWDLSEIHAKMQLAAADVPDEDSWWSRIWNR